jgi:metal-responsive CopG/Arc/MetJ family transcriptional regulator
MAKKEKVSGDYVTLVNFEVHASFLTEFDEAVREEGYASRAECLRALMRVFIGERKMQRKM